MLKILCSVLDKTVGYHAHPFVSHNEGSAIRDFAHACRDQSTALYKSPADFSLILVGNFDDETGEIIPVTHKSLAQAAQFSEE